MESENPFANGALGGASNAMGSADLAAVGDDSHWPSAADFGKIAIGHHSQLGKRNRLKLDI